MPLSHRYYLMDARFLAALAGPGDELSLLDEALRHPHWSPYLGRRSCPANQPVTLGVHDEYADVRDALETEPWIATERYRMHGVPPETLEVVYDAREGEACEYQTDLPLSFSAEGRRYAQRPVVRGMISNPSRQQSARESSDAVETPSTSDPTHDPLSFF